MSEHKTRKPIYQEYYIQNDYTDVLEKLPDIIKAAEQKAGEVLEPTVDEKREIMKIIKHFISTKNRKIYGGTAINETIKIVNPDDVIYDEHTFSDIEFYSPTPILDLVELTNLLYEKKYKYVIGKEAQHEETYTIFVNFQLYCDITYTPYNVYNGIKTIVIDKINYADPHFILIDQFRIINQPLTAASQRWEKTFKRVYKLLKNYPFEYFDKPITITKPTSEVSGYLSKIKNDFMGTKDVQETCLICGFEAYNFYIKHAISDRSVEQQARTVYDANKLANFIVNVPYLEFVSINYKHTVERLYNFIKEIVPDPTKITLIEYYPLFQYTGYSVFINYNNIPIAGVYETHGLCVPNVKTTKGYMYASYQYLLMFMLINKFREHLNKNREMYFNYSIAISNMVTARNHFLTKKKLGVINNTIFGEFVISCVGSTESYLRESQLRGLLRFKQGKSPFRYVPEQFFSMTKEAQAKFDPSKHYFKNTSGNKISNPKNLIFKLSENGNINTETEPNSSETESDYKSNERSSDNNPSEKTNIKNMLSIGSISDIPY